MNGNLAAETILEQREHLRTRRNHYSIEQKSRQEIYAGRNLKLARQLEKLGRKTEKPWQKQNDLDVMGSPNSGDKAQSCSIEFAG
jgi:hypothetical protein